MSSNPSFRTDLVAQPVSDAGQRFVDVTDPDSGKTFRFYEVEYSLACAMDGRRNVDQLADWALDELGLQASREELESVIGTLADLGYLEGLEGAASTNVPVVAEPVELGTAGGSTLGADSAVDISVDDMELGAPGRGAVARERPAMPSPDPVELGTAGPPGQSEDSFEGLIDEPATEVRPVPALPPRKAPPPPPPPASDFLDGITPPPEEQPSASLRPVTEPQLEEDGPTQLPRPATDYDEEEVSVDLSAHLSMGLDDVKEAVRASRVMQAVEVPADLASELDSAEQPFAPPPPPEAPYVPPMVTDAGSRPFELPEPPARPRRDEPVVPPTEKHSSLPQRHQPRTGVSPILIFLLIVVLGGAGAYYYFFVYKKDKDGEQTAKPGPGPKAPPGGKEPGGKPPGGKPPGGKEPPPPAAATAVLAQGATPAPVELTAPADGPIPWLAETGAAVNQGDVVAQLRDYPKHAKNLAEFEKRLLYYQGKLDAAQKKVAAGNPAAQRAVNEAKGKVAEKQLGIDDSKKAMAAATLTAPNAGTVEQVHKPGQWAKQGEVLVKITAGKPQMTATFTVGDGKTYAAGSTVEATTDGGSLTCRVISYTAGKLTVDCPDGKAGAKLTLK